MSELGRRPPFGGKLGEWGVCRDAIRPCWEPEKGRGQGGDRRGGCEGLEGCLREGSIGIKGVGKGRVGVWKGGSR
jgi:hypothetical protein